MRDYFLENEKENVDSVLTVAGFSFAGSGQNSGMAFIKLKGLERAQRGEERSANAIIGAPWVSCSASRKQVFAFNLPPFPELGTATGFDFFLQDRGGLGHEPDAAAQPVARHGGAGSQPGAGTPERDGRHPQLDIKIDYREGAGPGLSITDINNTLSAAWGPPM